MPGERERVSDGGWVLEMGLRLWDWLLTSSAETGSGDVEWEDGRREVGGWCCVVGEGKESVE